MIGLVLQRGVPLRPRFPNELAFSFMFGEPDQPIESYVSLCTRWLQLAKTPSKRKDAFRTWHLVLNKFSRHPRNIALDHLKWFLPVIPELSDYQDIAKISQFIEEIKEWNWRPTL